MLSKLQACGFMGVDGYIVNVETDISNGLPVFEIVGLGDAAVKESKERVKAALRNSGFEFPVRRVTVNLAPADTRKEGTGFDLAIALGILTSTDQIFIEEPEKFMFIGELSLDGQLRPVRGVLPMAICAFQNGVRYLMTPEDNCDEAAIVKGLEVLPVTSLSDAIRHLTGKRCIEPHFVDVDSIFSNNRIFDVDFADVRGQENVKRALEVAASGAHNCMMIGSPGSGKSMIARRLPTILPALLFEEALEVTKIHSIAGLLPKKTSMITSRPFRSPHHTISDTGLVGGGKIPKPGEISLAHFGVLFLDEVPEFSKEALEVLRQPIEDGVVTISRVNASLTYPANVMLVLAANPCKCGNYLDIARACHCTPKQIQQYMGRLSGPLLDRIDLHIEVASVKYKDLDSQVLQEKSHEIMKRVQNVRKLQYDRYKGSRIFSNAQLLPSMVARYCRIDDEGRALLKNAFDRMGLSARAYNRILKVARTIADMSGEENIRQEHLAEAIQYRSLDRRFWQG